MVMEVFSTITFPIFSELVIFIWGDTAARLPSEVKLFEALQAMNTVKPFKLVFSLMDPDSSLVEARRELAEALDSACERPFRFFRLPTHLPLRRTPQRVVGHVLRLGAPYAHTTPPPQIL